MRRVLLLDGKRHAVEVHTAGEAFTVTEGDHVLEGTRRWSGARLALELAPDGRRATAHVTRGAGGRLELWIDSERHIVDEERRAGAGGGASGGDDDALIAPMPAKVVRIAVVVGDAVEEGQTLVVLESMKMELGVTAPRAGRVAKVGAALGVIVPAGTMLIELEPAANGAAS